MAPVPPSAGPHGDAEASGDARPLSLQAQPAPPSAPPPSTLAPADPPPPEVGEGIGAIDVGAGEIGEVLPLTAPVAAAPPVLDEASSWGAPQAKPLPPAHPPPRTAAVTAPAAVWPLAVTHEGVDSDIKPMRSSDSGADGDADPRRNTGPGIDGAETHTASGSDASRAAFAYRRTPVREQTAFAKVLPDETEPVVLALLHAQLSAEDAHREVWRAQLTEIEAFAERARWCLSRARAAQRDEGSAASATGDDSADGQRSPSASLPYLAGRLAAFRPPLRGPSALGGTTPDRYAQDVEGAPLWAQHSPDVAEGLRIARGYCARRPDPVAGAATPALAAARESGAHAAAAALDEHGRVAPHSRVHISRRGSITIQSNERAAPLFGAPAPRELSLPFEAYPPMQVPTHAPAEMPEQERLPARSVQRSILPRLGDDGGFASVFDDSNAETALPWARVMYLGRNVADDVVCADDGASTLARFAADDAKLSEFRKRRGELHRRRRGG